MKTIMLIILFLVYSILTYQNFKNYYKKLFNNNKILFWVNSIFLNLLIPYTLLLFISIKINDYFIKSLHCGMTILLISILTSAFLNYKISNEKQHEK